MQKKVIRLGFKNVFEDKEIITGRELCEILDIDYDEILDMRKKGANENLDYFIDSLLDIEEVRDIIRRKMIDRGEI